MFVTAPPKTPSKKQNTKARTFMSARQYTTGGAKPSPFDTWNVQRDARRYLEAHSADPAAAAFSATYPRWDGILMAVRCRDGRRCSTPTQLPSARLRDLYLYGVLRRQHGAGSRNRHGLGSCVSVVHLPRTAVTFRANFARSALRPSALRRFQIIHPSDRHGRLCRMEGPPVEFAQLRLESFATHRSKIAGLYLFCSTLAMPLSRRSKKLVVLASPALC